MFLPSLKTQCVRVLQRSNQYSPVPARASGRITEVPSLLTSVILCTSAARAIKGSSARVAAPTFKILPWHSPKFNSALPLLKPHLFSLTEHLLYAQHYSKYFEGIIIISLILNTVKHITITILFVRWKSRHRQVK